MDKFTDWASNRLLNIKSVGFSFHFLIGFFFILPLLLIASFSIINSHKELTNFDLERRSTIAFIAASTVQEKLDKVIDVGISISTRMQFRRLIGEGKWEEATAIIEKIPGDFPYIDRISLFDKQGILRWATGINPEILSVIGQDFSYRDYYQGVSKNLEPYVAEAIKPAVPLGYNLVPIAIPIKSDSGEIIGISLLSIKLDTFAIWAKSIDIGPGGLVYIVDKKGHLIAHPTLLPAEDIIDFSSVEAVKKVLNGERGVEVTFNSIENEERVTAYEPVPSHGWGVIVAQPTKMAFADRDRYITKLSIIYGLLILFGIFLSYLFLKLINTINGYRQKERILLDSIGDGVVAIDRFWNITAWNRSSERIAGWKKEEVMGKPLRNFLKFLRERDRKENISFIEEAIVYGRVGFLENHTILITKDSKEIPVGDSAAPIFDPNGVVVGAIIVFRDTSMEKESSSLKSDFAYASHQLNTPVTKTLWNLESAIEDNKDPKLTEKLGLAYKSAQSIQKLNSQLYVISEIDQKIINPKYENVKLIDLIGEVNDGFKQMCKGCSVGLEIEPISPVLGLKTDPKMLKRILTEIVENAMFYSKTGGSVTLKASVDDNSLLFEISDNGIAIPDDQQTLIFTKFFRGNNFDTTNIIGAGLGLFIAKEYIKLLNGKIWFSSSKDKGTTFSVSLPIS